MLNEILQWVAIIILWIVLDSTLKDLDKLPEWKKLQKKKREERKKIITLNENTKKKGENHEYKKLDR